MKKEDDKPSRYRNQQTQILAILEAGQSINSLEARDRYGFQRLGARIWDLKAAGYSISSKLELMPNGKYVARHTLSNQ